MKYLNNWGEIQQVLRDTGASRFNVSRSGDTQGNDNVFMFDKDKSLEENMHVCERLLNHCAGEVLYLICWKTDGAKTGGCKYNICYDSVAATPVATPAAGIGSFGIGSVEYNNIRKQITDDITLSVRNQYERDALERERKELEDDRKEFEKDKAGLFGIAIEYCKPLIDQFTKKNVAGLDAEHDIEAARIKPKQAEVTEVVEETEEQDVFTDEEANKVFELIARFKAVEPQYLELIEAVVKMAEAGDSTYTMAKGILLK